MAKSDLKRFFGFTAAGLVIALIVGVAVWWLPSLGGVRTKDSADTSGGYVTTTTANPSTAATTGEEDSSTASAAPSTTAQSGSSRLPDSGAGYGYAPSSPYVGATPNEFEQDAATSPPGAEKPTKIVRPPMPASDPDTSEPSPAQPQQPMPDAPHPSLPSLDDVPDVNFDLPIPSWADGRIHFPHAWNSRPSINGDRVAGFSPGPLRAPRAPAGWRPTRAETDNDDVDNAAAPQGSSANDDGPVVNSPKENPAGDA